MGCNASKGVLAVEMGADGYPEGIPSQNGDVNVPGRPPKSLAFEVPLHDDEEDNVIKKHPPKRLQRLEDQQLPPLTHEALDEKQAEAEQRRLQILNQRIQSAKARQKLKRSLAITGDSNGHLIESMNREPSTVEL
ncbi:uncharacterized protein [Halyomorpha halys]|uniref:uncharacterized protein n=1 Tax=Halyomorpha halys TaxID=286706 RepID=UPI0006D5109F|nr:uncharacterized protein LOC106678952 [Halyomorpha halys]